MQAPCMPCLGHKDSDIIVMATQTESSGGTGLAQMLD
jgi:hypothetical protein